MRRLVVGDIQGCLYSFEALLEKAELTDKDELWIAGDLVNRGAHSLEVLERVQALDARIVLGNHDLHLLARSFGHGPTKGKDTLDNCLAKPALWRDYLLAQPLAVFDEIDMVHAGRYPFWSAAEFEAQTEWASREIQRSPDTFFKQMYGNTPSEFRDDLDGLDRLRFVVNACTRMRFLEGRQLNLLFKGELENAPANLTPWYESLLLDKPLFFGHWAALELRQPKPNLFATDSGCVWGNGLSAFDTQSNSWHWVPTDDRDYV